MPEFYFRPPPSGVPGSLPFGAYEHTDLNELLAAIESMFRNARFSHWLLVCGTAIFKDENPDVTAFVYNYALCKMGGASNEGYYFAKNQTSGIDGIGGANVPDAYIARARQSETFQRNRVLVPLSIGIEICLDHPLEVLKNTMAAWNWFTRPNLKLHILIAGGMRMVNNSIVSRTGKYFFRNDGMCGARNSQLEQVTGRSLWTGQVTTVNIPPAYTLALPVPMRLRRPPRSPRGPYPVVTQRVVFYPLLIY